MILGITLLVSFSCSAQKNITYPTEKGIFDQNGEYKGDAFFCLEEIIALCREKFNVDLEYKVPVNPSEIEFKRVIYKEHPDCPKAYILSFSSKEEKEDNKKRFIVIKDGTKEVVMDKLINRRIETPDGKDLIKVEEAYIPDKEIIKALLFLKK
jgi:hypothetical protein